MTYVLNGFHHIRPRYDVDQEQIQKWIVKAHAVAAKGLNSEEINTFESELSNKMQRLGLGKERIEKRGLQIDDLFEEDWSKMQIYSVSEHPHGKGFTERNQFFDREASFIFEQFYPHGCSMPDHMIHVTCTGYVAPSPAQKLVALRNAGKNTVVTHAYHMGCYGAIAALRIAAGYTSLPSPAPIKIDIVHTELCSLHMHPSRHASEQLLVQSLFADGFMKYTVGKQELSAPHLKVVATHEETIPDSSTSMTWCCENHGLGMTLSKSVPVLIARYLPEYLERLCELARVDIRKLKENGLFAIHPGGPKILQQIKELLSLDDKQIEYSVKILKSYGNMSSATLPHIWESILNDPEVPDQTFVLSLAFGPGLTIAGAIFSLSR